jgi:hypothetical protein
MSRTLRLSVWIACSLLAVTVLATAADTFKLLAPVENRTLAFHDEVVEIQFRFAREDSYYRRIGFALLNISEEAIIIDWSRSSITLPSGEASNVMHEGTKYVDAGRYSAPIIVPAGSTVLDSVIPTKRINYTPDDGWEILPMRIEGGAELGFYLTLTVAGEDRGYDFRFGAVEITNPKPDLRILVNFDFPAGTDSVQVPVASSVSFVAVGASNPDGTRPRYFWDYGDGTFAVGAGGIHIYDEPGSYEVMLAMTDNWEATSYVARTIIVTSEPEPTEERVSAKSEPTRKSGSTRPEPTTLLRATLWLMLFLLSAAVLGALLQG